MVRSIVSNTISQRKDYCTDSANRMYIEWALGCRVIHDLLQSIFLVQISVRRHEPSPLVERIDCYPDQVGEMTPKKVRQTDFIY